MLASAFLALALAATPAAPLGLADAVLSIQGGRWHGSALVWNRGQGQLLTALHVVEEMSSIHVRLAGGALVAARIVDRDPMLDLALLEVSGVELPPEIPIAARAGAVGDRLWLAGCPSLRCGTEPALLRVAERAFAGSRYVDVDGLARPGASGGALVDARGALVGIVDLALRRKGGGALAIPVERARARFPRLVPAAVVEVAVLR